MQTNTHGPLRIVNLIAKKARKPVSFVHMSTAYVGSCEPSGTHVMETLSHVNIDPEELIARIKTMTRAEIAAATPGWIGTHQNTYTFSKALGEMLLERHRGVVVRRAPAYIRPP
jgi:fatty acyl-CoA reductase